MLDNILNTVKRSAERVQRRGEEVAQVARLRMEVFQQTRELDGLFARLGRAYHAGADADLLQGIREEIRQMEDDIRARERLIDELNVTPEEAAAHEKSEPQYESPQEAKAGAAAPAPTTIQSAPIQAAPIQAAPAQPASNTPSNSPHFVDTPETPDASKS